MSLIVLTCHFQELYAAINGKGEENEGLKRNLEEIQTLLGDRQKELEEVTLKLKQSQEETSRLREQVILLLPFEVLFLMALTIEK